MSLFIRKDKTLKAFAKINPHLEVLNRRKDGFHNIFTLMATVDLFDVVALRHARFTDSNKPPAVTIAVSGGKNKASVETIPPKDNLITKAAEALCRRGRVSGEFAFSLEKNIPAGAGLGGGSADAAATLKLLNGEVRLSADELAEAAAETGSDVPFLLKGGSAVCEGRGELIESIDGSPEYGLVLIDCGISISTEFAYGLLSRTEDYAVACCDRKRVKALLKSFAAGEEVKPEEGLFINDFEEPIFKAYPSLADVKSRLLAAGADFAVMSGSGSAVVGIFSDKKKASQAVKRLKPYVKDAMLTRFTGNIEA